MEQNQADYDFLCGNDLKIIKLAVNSDGYHTARVHAESAKHIDFSGGTRNVEEIHLQHCLKLTRVVWPEFTGTIKRLKIIAADSLTHLDVSMLNNLEELSIIKCEKLVEVKGLKDKLKYLNLHQVNIKSVDISRCKNLQVVNVISGVPHFTLEAKERGALKTIAVEAKDINCHVVKCNNLFTLYLNSGDAGFRVEVENCPGINDVVLRAKTESVAIGFSQCEKLKFLYADESIIKIDGSLHDLIQDSLGRTAKQKIEEIIKENNQFRESIEHPEPGEEDVETIIEKHGTLRERNQATFIRINLLSASENEYFYSLKKEYLSFMKPIEESLNRFLHNPGIFMMKVKKMPEIPRFNLLAKKAIKFQNNPKRFLAWLKNVKRNQPNVLLIESSELDEANKAFFEKLDPKKQEIIYQDKKYLLTPDHKIIIVGMPGQYLMKANPVLFGNAGRPGLEGQIKYSELAKHMSRQAYLEYITAEVYRVTNQYKASAAMPRQQAVQVMTQLVKLADEYAKILHVAPVKAPIPGHPQGGAAVSPDKMSSKSSPFLYKHLPKKVLNLVKDFSNLIRPPTPGLKGALTGDEQPEKMPTPGQPLPQGPSLNDQSEDRHLKNIPVEGGWDKQHPEKVPAPPGLEKADPALIDQPDESNLKNIPVAAAVDRNKIGAEPISAPPAILPGSDDLNLNPMKNNIGIMQQPLELDRKPGKVPAPPGLEKADPALIDQADEEHLKNIPIAGAVDKRKVNAEPISAPPSILPGSEDLNLNPMKDNIGVMSQALELDRKAEKMPAPPGLVKADPALINEADKADLENLKAEGLIDKQKVTAEPISAPPSLFPGGEDLNLNPMKEDIGLINQSLELEPKAEKIVAPPGLEKADPSLINQPNEESNLKNLNYNKQMLPQPEPIAAEPRLIDESSAPAHLKNLEIKREVGEEEYSLGLDKPLKKQKVEAQGIVAEPTLIDDPSKAAHLENLDIKREVGEEEYSLGLDKPLKKQKVEAQGITAEPKLINEPSEERAHLFELEHQHKIELTLEGKSETQTLTHLLEAAGVLNEALKNMQCVLDSELNRDKKLSPDSKKE